MLCTGHRPKCWEKKWMCSSMLISSVSISNKSALAVWSYLWLSIQGRAHSYFVVATFFIRVLATCAIQWTEKWRGSWALDSALRLSMRGQGLTAGHVCDSHYDGKYPEEGGKMGWGPVVTCCITLAMWVEHGVSHHYFGPVRRILSGRCWLYPNICYLAGWAYPLMPVSM